LHNGVLGCVQVVVCRVDQEEIDALRVAPRVERREKVVCSLGIFAHVGVDVTASAAATPTRIRVQLLHKLRRIRTFEAGRVERGHLLVPLPPMARIARSASGETTECHDAHAAVAVVPQASKEPMQAGGAARMLAGRAIATTL
jgi:hypothetical protein